MVSEDTNHRASKQTPVATDLAIDQSTDLTVHCVVTSAVRYKPFQQVGAEIVTSRRRTEQDIVIELHEAETSHSSDRPRLAAIRLTTATDIVNQVQLYVMELIVTPNAVFASIVKVKLANQVQHSQHHQG